MKPGYIPEINISQLAWFVFQNWRGGIGIDPDAWGDDLLDAYLSDRLTQIDQAVECGDPYQRHAILTPLGERGWLWISGSRSGAVLFNQRGRAVLAIDAGTSARPLMDSLDCPTLSLFSSGATFSPRLSEDVVLALAGAMKLPNWHQ